MDFSFFYNQNIFLCPSYKEDWKTIIDSFKELCSSCTFRQLKDESRQDLNESLGAFDILEAFEPIYFIDAIQIASNGKHLNLCLLSINSNSLGPQISGLREQSQVEYAIVAYLQLKKNYGHVLMRPELLSDKISELFRKVEIDFNDQPEFSKNYFVLSEEEDLFTKTVSDTFLNTIGRHKGLFIEISNDQMILTFKKGLSRESIIDLTNIAFQILDSE